jgi:hypothetical protein
MRRMNTDFRIEVGFFAHHKTRRLIRRCGLAGPWSLLQLWEFAAINKPDGRLDGMSAEDIADAAKYEGDATEFVGALNEIGWLDRRGKTFTLHDWSEHQPHVTNAPLRKEIARQAAVTRWRKSTSSNAQSNAPSMPEAMLIDAGSNAPSFLPSYHPNQPTNQPPDSAAPLRAPAPVHVFSCVGNGPRTWPVTEADMARWKLAYPNVDLRTEIRRMDEWLRANNRKTANGMPKFVNRWLSKAQDSARSPAGPSRYGPQPVVTAPPRAEEPNRLLTPEEIAARRAHRGSA